MPRHRAYRRVIHLEYAAGDLPGGLERSAWRFVPLTVVGKGRASNLQNELGPASVRSRPRCFAARRMVQRNGVRAIAVGGLHPPCGRGLTRCG